MGTQLAQVGWSVDGCVSDPDARFLVAGGDPISRQLLGNALRESGRLHFVADVDIGRPVPEWPLDRVDLVVLVVGVQDDHLRTVRQLARNTVRVLLIGSGWTRAGLDAAFTSGAAGCLDRDTRIGGLATAARAVASGHTVLSPELLALYRAPARPVCGTAPSPAPSAAHSLKRLLSALTDREREVLSLLSVGLSTAEAAVSLKVSPATVKSHVSHAISKLGVRNRLEAVLLVQRQAGRRAQA